MDVKKIYFDMDGVLADFARGTAELCHIAPVDQSKSTRAQDDRLFEAIRDTEHFYDRLEPMPGAVEMFRAVWEKYKDRCEILTGIPKPWCGIVTAGEDKIAWVKRLLNPDVKVNIVFREEKKEYCKGQEYVLIDDFNKNIKEWESFGGTGILNESAEKTVERMRELGIL